MLKPARNEKKEDLSARLKPYPPRSQKELDLVRSLCKRDPHDQNLSRVPRYAALKTSPNVRQIPCRAESAELGRRQGG
jgi:hypothetical protein